MIDDNKIEILHIDDNRFDRELVMEALSESKYKITEADSKDEFKRLIHNYSFDLVLSDFNILDFDGLEVIEIVHGINPDLPVILVTGTGSEEIAVEALKKGAVDYIIKSHTHIRRLPNAIEAVLEKIQMEEELHKAQIHYSDFINSSSDIVSYWKVPDNLKIDLSENKQIEMLYDSVCIDCNRSAWELYGFAEKEEIIGKKYIDLIREKTFDKVFSDFIANGYQINDYESHQILKDGSKIYTLHNWHGSVEPDNKLSYIWTSFKNITERKKAEEELKVSLEDKEILIKELYHRTKNNMQIISSMLSLKARTIGDPDLIEIFTEMNNKIYGMSLVHKKLYESRNLSNLNLKEYIESLIQYLKKSTFKEIDLNVDGEDIPVLLDTAMPCGIIINEFVTNSIKHAFPDIEKGQIDIHFYNEKNNLIIELADNGIGLPENFDFKRDEGIGLQTMISLVEHQLQGKINFENRNGMYCRILI